MKVLLSKYMGSLRGHWLVEEVLTLNKMWRSWNQYDRSKTEVAPF